MTGTDPPAIAIEDTHILLDTATVLFKGRGEKHAQTALHNIATRTECNRFLCIFRVDVDAPMLAGGSSDATWRITINFSATLTAAPAVAPEDR